MRDTGLEVNGMVTEQRAREIMGEQFFGLEEFQEVFCCSPSNRELEIAEQGIPFREQTLKRYKGTHILVFTVATSMIDVVERLGKNRIIKENFFNRADFGHYKEWQMPRCDTKWNLVRMGPSGSDHKTWEEQKREVEEGGKESVPNAVELVYAIFAYGFKVYHSMSILPEHAVGLRTATPVEESSRIIIWVEKCGPFVSDGGDDQQHNFVSSMIKQEEE